MTDHRRYPIARIATVLALAWGLTASAAAAPGNRKADRYRFVDVTVDNDVYQQTRTWGSAWADYDYDGDPDFFVVRHWRTPRMFVNTGSGYRRLRRQTDLQGTQMDRHQCAWGEADHDGRPDLYCVQGADKGKGSGSNQLLLYRDGDLVDETSSFGLADRLGRGRTLNWLDHDGDGDLDIFVGNAFRADAPNVLFERTGTRFVRSRSGVENHLDTVGSSWADPDRDGDPDLLVMQHRPGKPILYVNNGGRFSPTHVPYISSRSWYSGAWADFDGDGWIDLHLVSRKRSLILKNLGGTFAPAHRLKLVQGRMSVWLDLENDGDLDAVVLQGAHGQTPETGGPNRREMIVVWRGNDFVRLAPSSLRGPAFGNADSIAAVDHDRNGRVDLFVTNGLYYFDGPNQLLESRSRVMNWAAIQLRGVPQNPFGYGARVIVQAGDKIYRRDVTDGVVFRSQSEAGYVHLGLGSADRATVNVRWPDGTLDCFIMPHGRVIVIEQGTLPCA